MRATHHVILAAGLVLVGLAPALASAADGVLLVQTIASGTTKTTSQVQLEPNRIRTVVADGSGREQVVTFDGTRDVLFIVNMTSKSYTELTRADAAKMGGMMADAMAMMQEQLARMPPAQRKAMEEKMGPMMGSMAGSPAAGPQYKRVGSGQVGKWACERYDAFVNGAKTSEICTVQPQALGFSVADFGVLAKMADFVRSMVPSMANQVMGLGTPDQGFSGLPVRTVTTIGGTTAIVELTEVRRQTFDDASFLVPSGFTRQPMMGQ